MDDFDVLRHLKTAIWVFDVDNSRVVKANDAAVNIWQAASEEDLCDRDLSQGMSITVRDRLRQYQRDFIDRDAKFNEMWTLYPNGVPTTLRVYFSGFMLPGGRMAMMCEVPGAAEDTPDNIRSAEALLHTDVMITLYDDAGEALYMNPMARRSAPRGQARFRDRFVTPEDHDDIVCQALEKGEHRHVAEVITEAGSSWYDLSVKRCTDAVTGQPATLVTAVDVSELKMARDRARYLADCDQLTGCYNRAYFTRALGERLHEAQKDRFALVFIDLDRFKLINDSFGHEVGDAVLHAATARLQGCLGTDDLLARFGGDEFVALLRLAEGETSPEVRIEAIQTAINQPVVHKSTRVALTTSIGIAIVPPGATDWSEYMKRADIALYESKQAGRNRASLFDEDMNRAAAERFRIEQDLKRAIAEDQFILHFQPRVDAQSGRVMSVEALVRWEHPVRGMVSPDAFIPVCEETGMIEELGNLVLRKACDQMIAWHQNGMTIGMSVNVSPRQFLDARFMEIIAELSRRPGFPVGRVELEITETALVGDHDMLAEQLRRIVDYGFRVSVDDFGTGYSNLAYISRFPICCIKIDKSFVDELPTSEPIIRLIHTLADQIGAITVAEGVETEQQAKALRKIGCQQMQGYYFAYPVPMNALDVEIARIGRT
ncbi:EAL domain-containing protein [uncultured Roseobacter sp.]|uniref:putative bifunctional diguanylate cyclase/phosphodiesterase n=1 Tax=uncultured Roseobacter sp. TaxID=114847 RepID=UPI002611B98C|nr:EAL domain-containing protein [uncultured Roseobacter sp.]